VRLKRRITIDKAMPAGRRTLRTEIGSREQEQTERGVTDAGPVKDFAYEDLEAKARRPGANDERLVSSSKERSRTRTMGAENGRQFSPTEETLGLLLGHLSARYFLSVC
jgi:hypothetical protein